MKWSNLGSGDGEATTQTATGELLKWSNLGSSEETEHSNTHSEDPPKANTKETHNQNTICEDNVTKTEQLHAVAEMAHAATELQDILNSTEAMVNDSRTLDTFKDNIVELNHQHALTRVTSVIGLQPDTAPASSYLPWNRTLSDHVTVNGNLKSDEEELLSMVGGPQADVSEGSDSEEDEQAALMHMDSVHDPFAAIAPLPPTRPQSANPRGRTSRSGSRNASFQQTTARVVGSLTPEMAGNMRRGSSGAVLSRPGSRGSVTFATEMPAAQALVVQDEAQGGQGGQVIQGAAGRREDSFCSKGSFVSSNGSFARSGRRHSTPSVGRASFRQRDSSQTQVTGKVDYTALLTEQQENLHERKSSMKDYNSMCGWGWGWG